MELRDGQLKTASPILSPRLLLALAMLTPFVFFFAPVLLSDRGLAFRDSAHFYLPLFEWIAEQWRSGGPPLWNPYDNLGAPVLADVSSSIFYPGKLIFASPLSTASEFKLYVAGHVLLSLWAARRLATHWRCSPMAGAACGIAYAFGGSVLFQHCNVVFLVGAAWMPLALLAGATSLERRSWRAAGGLAVVLAMMVLGGDPQAAYHAGLLLGGYGVFLWWSERRGDNAADAPCLDAPSLDTPSLDAPSRDKRSLDVTASGKRAPRWLLLSASAAAAFLLAAIQILPAVESSRRSHRAAYERPRNIYEWAAHRPRPPGSTHERGSFLDNPPAGSHHALLYQFSVGPWRWSEFVWPNIGGRMYPQNRRWFNAIPAEGRIWSPSLYLGLLTVALAVVGSGWRNAGATTRWLTCWTAFAILAACGWYGLGWIAHEIRFAILGPDAEEWSLAQPAGGLYWLLVTFLPGYVMFRFPAKWMTVAALGVSLLAARGWDRAMLGRPRRWLSRSLMALAAISGVGVLLTLVGSAEIKQRLSSIAPDNYFGPFDAGGALGDVTAALLQTTCVAAVAAGLLAWRTAAKDESPEVPHWRGGWLLALLVVDLCAANAWLIPLARGEIWRRPSPLATAIAQQSGGGQSSSAVRIYRGAHTGWRPRSWARQSSAQRLSQGVQWDRDTLFPKYHLLEENAALGNLSAYSSLSSQDLRLWMQTARSRGAARSDRVREPAVNSMRGLGAVYYIVPEDVRFDPPLELVPLELGPVDGRPANVRLWRDPQALPRAWIADRAEAIPPLDSATPEQRAARFEQIQFPGVQPRNWRRDAIVEAEQNALPELFDHGGRSTCRIVNETPHRVEIEAALAAPGLLVLADQHYPGWKVETRVEGESVARRLTIHRTNGLVRGVVLPRGVQRVVFRYAPRSFAWGAWISGAAWLALAVAVGRRRVWRSALP